MDAGIAPRVRSCRVGLCDANCTRFDGPLPGHLLGFSRLVTANWSGRRICLMISAFDRVRHGATKSLDTMRAQGPFEPHRLASEEMEHTNPPGVEKELLKRWEPLSS